ncbi:MAG: methylated-DNA--[protein]-cysteine S-methyltransferase [Nitrospira sp.]|jgi:methylated-DNA-[protein]-cysteine S-methyltransferase|nr:methylated-DNA--[protein]-cysteine S-methyltransferase [Nitrospira sp.]MBP6607790.1 methylated-DNA--[protein]-cysteine S-methyltransferase [Nitrospira sp.]HQY57208.1 methylated-DNA--[protein]-cysteine S-methyltransferase [Nitrospira sp.]HRA98747.1 methylated-DNA--[protein]-cysteine S-methyltransferase [Nitrospira sp.]
MTYTSTFETPWGQVTITASEKGVTSINLSSQDRAVRQQPAENNDEAASIVEEARAQLLAYIAGTRREFSFPIDCSAGTPFQRKVWRAITRIPYGRVRSYQWVAMRVGGKQYARAVGMALGANPVPIVVPCHRIISHDGSLGGFSCGLPLKRRLLSLEGTLAQLRNAQ